MKQVKLWFLFLLLNETLGIGSGLFATYVTRNDPSPVFVNPWPLDGLLVGATVGFGFWVLCVLGNVLVGGSKTDET